MFYVFYIRSVDVKKRNNVFVAFALCLVCLFQPIGGFEAMAQSARDAKASLEAFAMIALCAAVPQLCLVGAAVVIPTVIVIGIGGAVVNSVRESRREDQKLNALYQKECAYNATLYEKDKLLASKFPETIKERIEALIALKYQGENEKSFEIFSTPKSKIFVLQNIQDFFDFQQGEEFKNFNLLVYEICTAEINKLERYWFNLGKAVEDKSATEAEKQLYEQYNAIDTAQDNYKKAEGISTSTLKDMSSAEVGTKIKNLDAAMTALLEDLKKKVTIDRNTDDKFRALVSILAHLYFKQSKKELMFVGEGLKKGWERPAGEYIPKKANLEGITVKKKAALLRSMGKNPKDLKYSEEEFQKKQKEYQKAAEEKKQRSFWSTVKSWFGW